MGEQRVWVRQNGLRAEGVVLRPHTSSPGWYLVLVPGGEHWFSDQDIEWSRETENHGEVCSFCGGAGYTHLAVSHG